MNKGRVQKFRYHTRSFRNRQFDNNRIIALEEELETVKKNKRKDLASKRKSAVLPLSSKPLYIFENEMSEEPSDPRGSNRGRSEEPPLSGFMSDFSLHGPNPVLGDPVQDPNRQRPNISSNQGAQGNGKNNDNRRKSLGTVPKNKPQSVDIDLNAQITRIMNLVLDDFQKRQAEQTEKLVTQVVTKTIQNELSKNLEINKNYNPNLHDTRFLFPQDRDNILNRNNSSRFSNLNTQSQVHAEPRNVREEFQEFLSNESNLNNFSQNDKNTQLDKWGLKFDPKLMTIDDFIFRVEAFQKSYRCSWQHIFENFHFLVTGRAEKFLWQFRRCNPNSNWQDLKQAFIRNFAPLDTYLEISRMMYERRQLPNESFGEFYDAIIDLNIRLSTAKKDERELIEIIRANVCDPIAELIFNTTFSSLAELHELGRKAERFLKRRHSKPKFVNARVHEIESPDFYNCYSKDGDDHEIEAFGNPQKIRQDFSKIRCFNCDSVGHRWKDCTSIERRLFCYKCGRLACITPNCPNCKNSENLKRSVSHPGTYQNNPNLEN